MRLSGSCLSGSPVKRVGRDRFVRNVLIAIGNSGNPDFIPVAEHLLVMLLRWCAPWRCGPWRN